MGVHAVIPAPRRTVYLESFGCQMNVLDAENLFGLLSRRGYVLETDPWKADVVLLNTCSVRDHAEQRAISIAGQFKHRRRNNPRALLGIIGCMAQRDPEGIREKLPHVDLLCGPRNLSKIPDILDDLWTAPLGPARGKPVTLREMDEAFLEPSRAAELRPTSCQAYVKAMEGCNCSCTFCIVPTVRGPEVSRPPAAIVEEVQLLAGGGVREVTLLGQTVNAYGKGLSPRTSLADLLAELDKVDGLARIRFITSHPLFAVDGLFQAMRDLPKVCETIHLPVQSGSTRILKAMHRGYTAERYREIAATFRETLPTGGLATDVIVGFPGETDADFEETVRLVRELRFQYSFVFKFSPRPGTAAAAMADDVPEAVKRERNQIVLEAQKAVSLERNLAKIGSTVEVLVEGPPARHPASYGGPPRWTGRTRNFEIVVFEADRDRTGELVDVEISHATPLALYGAAANTGRA